MLVGLIQSPSDRVRIWAGQLAANDFPPVCALTGRPAEVWRKFRFATPPQWAYALLVLICLGGIGLIAYAVVISTIAQRATGHLPLTRAARSRVEAAIWVPAGLIIGWVVLWVIAVIVSPTSNDQSGSGLAAAFFFLGFLALVAGLVGRLVIMRFLVIQARVFEPQPGQLDKIVELRNLHPNFVHAVQQAHAARLAQSTGQALLAPPELS